MGGRGRGPGQGGGGKGENRELVAWTKMATSSAGGEYAIRRLFAC